MESKITIFENNNIRRVYDEKSGKWCFSVVDIVAILIEKDAYLLELARYVALNPVRAGMVARAEDWPWSSYRTMIGAEPAPAWLALDGLLRGFGRTRSEARMKYIDFVCAGVNLPSIWNHLTW